MKNLSRLIGITLTIALMSGLSGFKAEAGIFKSKKKQETTAFSEKKDKVKYDTFLKDAKTSEGLFKIHKIKEKYYFEIPVCILDRDFLISSRVSTTSNNKDIAAGQMPHNPVLVTFTKDKKKLYMYKKKSIRYGKFTISNASLLILRPLLWI